MANATITATVAEQTVQENNDAVVRFHLSSALTSSTGVKVSVNPQGGATTADYGPLFYHMGILPGGWLSVPNDGVITINAGFTDFELKTNITNDTITEGYDSLAFTVAQTASSVGIADSWWVPSLVNLLDAVGTGAAALPRTITAGTPTPAAEGSRAEAPFVLNHAGTGYADTQVRVSMYGLGGATAADYTTGTLLYKVGTGGWSPVVGGLITVPGADNSFSLGMEIKTDSLTESTEGIAFNVAQTTSSIGLVDSWWVQSTVDLQDAQGTGAKALLRTITADTSTSPGIEGSTAPATATFHVSYDPTDLDGINTADYANTTVKVSMYGLGGATAADYATSAVFSYHIGTSGGWTSVPSTGLIPIDSTTTAFQLSMQIKSDTIAETGEGIAFNVAQTTSSIGLVDSWFVQSIVDLADATSIYTTVTGSIGPDHFTANSGTPDMFVIPIGTSKATADGATGLIAGDVSAFVSGEQFDTITGFAIGTDRIDLPATVTTVGTITSKGMYASELALLTALQNPLYFTPLTSDTEIGTYTITGHTDVIYVIVDTSLDGSWKAADDMFIRLVGTGIASLAAAPTAFV